MRLKSLFLFLGCAIFLMVGHGLSIAQTSPSNYAQDSFSGDAMQEMKEEVRKKEIKDREWAGKYRAQIEAEDKKIYEVPGYKITGAELRVLAKTLSELTEVLHDDLKLINPTVPNKELFKYEKIDITSRHMHFSEQGWEEYKKYLSEQRELLCEKNRCAEGNAVAGYVKPENIKLRSLDSNDIELSSEIFLGWGHQSFWCDYSGCEKHVKLIVIFRPNASRKPDDIIIDSWRVVP